VEAPARPRERAPRREGKRTQLTVPTAIWDEAVRLAAALGTTPNDVLVGFAAEGMHAVGRRLELARIAEERWRGYLEAEELTESAGFPSEEAAVRAAQTLRRELSGD